MCDEHELVWAMGPPVDYTCIPCVNPPSICQNFWYGHGYDNNDDSDDDDDDNDDDDGDDNDDDDGDNDDDFGDD